MQTDCKRFLFYLLFGSIFPGEEAVGDGVEGGEEVAVDEALEDGVVGGVVEEGHA